MKPAKIGIERDSILLNEFWPMNGVMEMGLSKNSGDLP